MREELIKIVFRIHTLCEILCFMNMLTNIYKKTLVEKISMAILFYRKSK